MGNRPRGLSGRLAVLFTIFCFFFAGIRPLYLYIALLNALHASEAREGLRRPRPAIGAMLLLILCAFIALTDRAYLRNGRTAAVDT